MDWDRPLRSMAATVDADVLEVLAVAQDAVTGNELACLAGRFYAQVYAVVGRMVAEGLVVRSDSVDDRDLTWRRQLDELARLIEAMSGNPVRLPQSTRSELRAGSDGAHAGAGDHRREARIIVGAALPHPIIRTSPH